MSENRKELIGSIEPESMEKGAGSIQEKATVQGEKEKNMHGNANKANEAINRIYFKFGIIVTVMSIVCICVAAIAFYSGFTIGKSVKNVAENSDLKQMREIADYLQEIDVNKLKKSSVYVTTILYDLEKNSVFTGIQNDFIFYSTAVKNDEEVVQRLKTICDYIPEDSTHYEDYKKILMEHQKELDESRENLNRIIMLKEALDSINNSTTVEY